MQTLEICCLIITYNPDENLNNLVNIIAGQVDKIIIVDNNTVNNGKDILLKIGHLNKVHLIQNEENLGIAKALNQGIQYAAGLKFKWVLTFDQDSLPYDNIVTTLSEVYSSYPDKDQIGAIGINYTDDLKNVTPPDGSKAIYRKKDYLITSGCLLSVDAFLETGGFREDFFIDNVDLEYSLRLREYGKISLITRKIGMNHKAGNPGIKKICGLTFLSSNHNIFRRYYMARNHILLTREYFFKFPYFILKLNYFFILSLFQILIVDEDKKAKFSASIKGIIDGFRYSSKYRKRSTNNSVML